MGVTAFADLFAFRVLSFLSRSFGLVPVPIYVLILIYLSILVYLPILIYLSILIHLSILIYLMFIFISLVVILVIFLLGRFMIGALIGFLS